MSLRSIGALRVRALSVCLALSWLTATAWAQEPELSPRAQRQIAALMAEKASRTPQQRKMSSHLVRAAKALRGQPMPPDFPALPDALRSARVDARNFVEVDIRASITPELLSAIAVVGGSVVRSFPKFDTVRASLPLLALEQLAARPDVKQVAMAERPQRHGQLGSPFQSQATARRSIAGQFARYWAVGGSRGRTAHFSGLGGVFRSLGKAFFIGPNSTGDLAHQGASARSTFGVTGAGVKVGVLSDGVTTLATEQAAGRLPADVTVLPGYEGDGDEGTAMMEIIHTLAPGASLYFATATNGRVGMADAMQALADAGCRIIVDDISYAREGVYQDSEIALKVNDLAAAGVVMVSAAGNRGNLLKSNSGVWEGDYVNGGPATGPLAGSGTFHNFGGGATSIVISTPSAFGEYQLAWSDPNGASDNDYDLFVFNSALTDIIDASTDFQTGLDDPMEIVFNDAIPAGSRIIVGNFIGFSGPAAQRTLFVNTNGGKLSLSTGGSIHGHLAAAGAISVGAVNVSTAGGGAFTGGATNPVTHYSADGPRRMYYKADGTPITPGNVLMATNGGAVLNKPDFSAADGVPTGVAGFNPFFGTSAAAPHVAALAALLLQAHPSYSPAQVRAALQASALDIEGAGFDVTSGYGIAMAPGTLSWASTGVTITSVPDTGRGFTVTGPGCMPGSYTTPATLQWGTGASCTVQWASPAFPIPDLRYTFSKWHDNSTSNPRPFISTGGLMTLTGTFKKEWRLTTQASPGAGGSVAPSTGFFDHGTAVTLTPTASSGFRFTGWAGAGGGAYSGQALNPIITMTAPVTETAKFVATSSLGFSGSLAQIAFEGGWKTTMTGLNLGTSSANLRLNFFRDDGDPMTLPLTFPQTPAAPPVSQSTYNTVLGSNAQIVVATKDPTLPSALQGWGQLLADGRVSGFGIYSNPAQHWEAVVPLEMRNASRYVMAFDNTVPIATGVAIANVTALNVVVQVIIRDHAGVILFSGDISLGPNEHQAFMLGAGSGNKYRVTAGKRGTIEFQTPAGGQISALGLRAYGAALTTLPVLADAGSAGGSITHILFNDVWKNSFTLVNMGTTTASATLNFFDETGAALGTPLLLPQTGETLTTTSLTKTLGPGASLLIETVGNPAAPVVVGSAELSSTGYISGFGIFRWERPGEPIVPEASVPVEDRNTGSYVLVFDNTNGLTTGLALASTGAQNLEVTIRDDTGALLLSTTLSLPAHGHTSFMLPDVYPVAAGKRGTIEFTRTTASKFSVVGLRATPDGNVTTIPVMSR